MIEKIHQKLSDSKVARWSVLALAAFTMLCGYVRKYPQSIVNAAKASTLQRATFESRSF